MESLFIKNEILIVSKNYIYYKYYWMKLIYWEKRKNGFPLTMVQHLGLRGNFKNRKTNVLNKI